MKHLFVQLAISSERLPQKKNTISKTAGIWLAIHTTLHSWHSSLLCVFLQQLASKSRLFVWQGYGYPQKQHRKRQEIGFCSTNSIFNFHSCPPSHLTLSVLEFLFFLFQGTLERDHFGWNQIDTSHTISCEFLTSVLRNIYHPQQKLQTSQIFQGANNVSFGDVYVQNVYHCHLQEYQGATYMPDLKSVKVK